MTKKRLLSFIAVTLFILLGIFLFMYTKPSKQIKDISATSTVSEKIKSLDKNNLVNGQWQYMSGVSKTAEGLVVHPTHFAIVAQNGSFVQDNPPINLAGTHLEKVTGDFTVNATIHPQNSKMVSLQFYGRAPIIADEFRVERESVRLSIAKGKMTVSIWNGSGQTPTVEKSFIFTPNENIDLRMARQGDILNFTLNDRNLGSVSQSGAFQSGQVWFGLDSDGGDWLLSDLRVEGNITVADNSDMKVTTHDPNGLQALAAKKRSGFVVGMAQAIGSSFTDPEYFKVAFDKNMFGSLTPENEMKMINLQPERGIYTFEKADALVHLAKQNGLTIHGHTLVFGEANPLWFNQLTQKDYKQIEPIMRDHITKVVTHYKGQISSWDVINEPMADYDDTQDGEGAILRQHKWYQAMGESYIIKALDAAHRADPDALLFINEYGLEEDGARWNAFLNLIQRLKPQLEAHGIPTDKIGVGFQAHIYSSEDRIDPAVLRQHIQTLAKLGFKTQISENDVYSDDGATVQANQYADIFKACLNEPTCIAWRGWILSDRYNYWQEDDSSIQTGVDGLFDTNMHPRPALKQMQQ